MLRFGRRTFLVARRRSGLISCAPKAADLHVEHRRQDQAHRAPLWPDLVDDRVLDGHRTDRAACAEPTSTSVTAASGGPATFVRTGDETGPRSRSTFHGAGDPDLVERLADCSPQSKVPVTLFAVGEWLDENPKLAAPARRGRPRVGEPHLHPPSAWRGRPRDYRQREIADCRQALSRMLGNGGSLVQAFGNRHTDRADTRRGGGGRLPDSRSATASTRSTTPTPGPRPSSPTSPPS